MSGSRGQLRLTWLPLISKAPNRFLILCSNMPVFLCLHQFVPSFICPSALFILQNGSFINVFMCFLPARGCAPWLMGTWWTIWQIESLQEGHPRLRVLWKTASKFLQPMKMSLSPPQSSCCLPASESRLHHKLKMATWRELKQADGGSVRAWKKSCYVIHISQELCTYFVQSSMED